MKKLNLKTEEIAENYEQLYNITMQLWPECYKGYYIETQFGKTWINEIGDEKKPVLLLLHGMSGSSTLWYSNVEQLSKHFRVLAPDIIGQAGKSISEKPLKSANDLEIWLDEVIENLQLTNVHLAGMSFGGWLAIRYALYNSKKITKIVVLDPSGTITLHPTFGFNIS